MAVSYLKEHFVFRVMTEDVIEKCEDYTCEKDTEIEEFFKSEYKDYNHQLLGKSYCFLTRDENPRLACAFSLANSSVRNHGLLIHIIRQDVVILLWTQSIRIRF